METYFAPAKKTDRRKFKNQVKSISKSPLIETLLKTMAGLLIILNEDRQIVAMNHAFLEEIGIDNPEEVLGIRLGESLRCIHSNELPHGCGTTVHCATCGAAMAMMTAINENKMAEQVCALTSEKEGIKEDICLMVRAQPVEIEGHRWILIFAQDITQQQFWVNLEHVFFHDINNLLNPLLGFTDLLASELPDNMAVQHIKHSAERLLSEISLQRSLSYHKDTSYLLRKTETSLFDIKKEVSLFLKGHKAAARVQIKDDWPSEDIIIYTDSLLVSRVLCNMALNAMEASPDGGTVRLSTEVGTDNVTWQVANQGVIPEKVQKRIFQKHFSTKSNVGRGLGTYSMKLFGEKYLHGKVSFASSPENGTVFTFSIPRA